MMEAIVVVGLHPYPQWRGMQRGFFLDEQIEGVKLAQVRVTYRMYESYFCEIPSPADKMAQEGARWQ